MLVLMQAVQVDAGVDVGSLIVTVLAELQMTHKECWITMGIDKGTLSRGLSGEAPLDFWKLRYLPMRFWQALLPRLASAFIQQYFADLSLPYRQARADIRAHEDKQRSA